MSRNIRITLCSAIRGLLTRRRARKVHVGWAAEVKISVPVARSIDKDRKHVDIVGPTMRYRRLGRLRDGRGPSIANYFAILAKQ